MNSIDDINEIKKSAGSCYGCYAYPGKDYTKCDEEKNIKKMKKVGSPCYCEAVSVLPYSSHKDEFDNVCDD
jgi:hypothetical protein